MSDAGISDGSVELIVFDLGGVLVRVVESWAEACAAANVDPRSAPKGEGLRERLGAVNALAERGAIDADEFVRRCAEASGLSAGEIERILTAWVPRPFPGAAELLVELAGRGHRTACLSNTNHFHWRMLMEPEGFFGLRLHHLSERFASHLIGRAKPDEAAYEHVERATGVAPGRILFFDDLAPNGRAAAARGWQFTRIVAGDNPIEQIRGELERRGLV